MLSTNPAAMYRRADGRHVRLSDVIPDDVAVVETPDGRAWYRDEERCCEHDDGLRPYNPWRDNQHIHCNGCGALVFVT